MAKQRDWEAVEMAEFAGRFHALLDGSRHQIKDLVLLPSHCTVPDGSAEFWKLLKGFDQVEHSGAFDFPMRDSHGYK